MAVGKKRISAPLRAVRRAASGYHWSQQTRVPTLPCEVVRGLEAQVAGGEVELLVVEGVVGDVHLAVLAADVVFGFGGVVEDGGGVVVEAGGSALEEAGYEDDLLFADYGGQALRAWAGDGLGESEEGVVFALAEVLGGE